MEEIKMVRAKENSVMCREWGGGKIWEPRL